jgi:hypothetical protein
MNINRAIYIEIAAMRSSFMELQTTQSANKL